MKKIITLVVTLTFYLNVQGQDLFINEICSSGCGAFGDEIELYNGTSSSIDLAGYYLTDGDTTKWSFNPNANTVISSVIDPGEYIIIYCNGDPTMASFHRQYRTNFSLSASGETVRLFTPSKVLVGEVTYPPSVSEETYGRMSDGSYSRFTNETIGAPNDESSAYTVDISLEAPVVNAPNEIFTSSVVVDLSSNLGLPIYYTIDGSEPTLSSPVYSVPFSVNATTVIKCAHFNASGEIGLMGLKTLLFNKTHTLPIINITSRNYKAPAFTVFFNGFVDSTSIQSAYFNGKIWIEFYETDGSTAFAQYARYAESGYSSSGLYQINGKVRVAETYDETLFPNHFFLNKPQIEEVKGFQLRNSSQDISSARLREAFCSKMISQDGLVDFGFEDYRPSVVYVNGIYQGVLNMREDNDADFIENNFPDQDAEREDFVNTVLNYSYTRSELSSVVDSLEQLYGYDRYFLYAWMQMYLNADETALNIYTFNDGTPAYWVSQDDDMVLNELWSFPPKVIGNMDVDVDYPNPLNGLENNEVLRDRMVQAWCSYANFLYDSERTISILDEMEAELDPEMQGHALFNQELLVMAPNLDAWGTPFTTVAQWKSEVDKIRQTLTVRTDSIEIKMKEKFNLPDLVDLTASTNDKTMGSVAVEGVKLRDETMTGDFFSDLNLRVEAIPEVGYRFVEWEGVSTSNSSEIVLNLVSDSDLKAIFEAIPYEVVDLHLNEVQSKNDTTYADEFGEYNDWVEIFNSGTSTIDLAGYYLSDNREITNKYEIKATDPTKTTVESNGFILFWLDKDTIQGENHINFKLSASDQVYLVYPDGLTILDSLNFSLQADKSFGLQIDGEVGEIYFDSPTPNATNVVITNTEILHSKNTAIILFPNPSLTSAKLLMANGDAIESWELFNTRGELLLKGDTVEIEVGGLTRGVYIIKANNQSIRLLKE